MKNRKIAELKKGRFFKIKKKINLEFNRFNAIYPVWTSVRIVNPQDIIINFICYLYSFTSRKSCYENVIVVHIHHIF